MGGDDPFKDVGKDIDTDISSEERAARDATRLADQQNKYNLEAQRAYDSAQYHSDEIGIQQEKISVEEMDKLRAQAIELYKLQFKMWQDGVDPKQTEERRKEDLKILEMAHPNRVGSGVKKGMDQAHWEARVEAIKAARDYYVLHPQPEWNETTLEKMIAANQDTAIGREIQGSGKEWLLELFRRLNALGPGVSNKPTNADGSLNANDPRIEKVVNDFITEQHKLTEDTPVGSTPIESAHKLQSDFESIAHLPPEAFRRYSMRMLATNPGLVIEENYQSLLNGRTVLPPTSPPATGPTADLMNLINIGNINGREVDVRRGTVGGTFTGSDGKTTLIPGAGDTPDEKETIYHTHSPFKNMEDVAGAPQATQPRPPTDNSPSAQMYQHHPEYFAPSADDLASPPKPIVNTVGASIDPIPSQPQNHAGGFMGRLDAMQQVAAARDNWYGPDAERHYQKLKSIHDTPGPLGGPGGVWKAIYDHSGPIDINPDIMFQVGEEHGTIAHTGSNGEIKWPGHPPIPYSPQTGGY